MEKVCRALCLSQNGSSNVKSCKKNEEIATLSETPEECLKNWKLPPFPASHIYKRSGLFNSSPIKTVEKEIPLSEGYATFSLFSENLKNAYNKFARIHVGMIQVGLKSTKLGSNASAIICLRDARHSTFAKSVLAMAESSLCDGPIYFSHFPRFTTVYLVDRSSRFETAYVYLYEDLSSSFSIDIKTQGCSSDETIILMYRLHYRVLDRESGSRTRDLGRYRIDQEGITTLFRTDTNHIWSKKISWCDEIAIPERWVEWTETAEYHLLQVDAPAGFKKEEIQVRVEAGRILRISGERKEESIGNCRVVFPMRESSFLRRLRVPENAKAEEVRAVMENGVLVVLVPKEEINEELKEKVVGIVGC